MKQKCDESVGMLVWEASSNNRSSCFIRELQTLKNNENIGATMLGFHYFLAIRTPDETLKFVFELLYLNSACQINVRVEYLAFMWKERTVVF